MKLHKFGKLACSVSEFGGNSFQILLSDVWSKLHLFNKRPQVKCDSVFQPQKLIEKVGEIRVVLCVANN